MTRITIIGAGLYGAFAAKKLSKVPGLEITLISKKNYINFVPSVPRNFVTQNLDGYSRTLEEIFGDSITLIYDEAVSFDDKKVTTRKNGDVAFDVLIVATGSILSHEFELPNTVDSAVEHFKKEFEQVERAKNITVIGGGISGCELVGELAHKFKDEIAKGEKRINLIHSNSNVLSDHEINSVRQSVKYQLEGMNVKLYLGQKATLDGDKVYAGSEEVPTDHIIWTTGVKPNTPDSPLEGLKNEKGEIKVKPTFQTVASPNIFAIGDCVDFVIKAVAPLKKWNSVLVDNVIAYVQDKPLTKQVVPPTNTDKPTCGVSLGPEHAAGQIATPFGTFSLPAFLIVQAKSKTMFKGRLSEI
ncbi:hypothetical protein KL918_003663 [Ogataea parapolymorpha]|uniref:Mitochondrial cell death effector that translocates to the nucleus in response to apoptotic stimuli n=1 Tax=Ogataea parapolymorpha (strain ATCC 26012 / BCRC 20466 / JCM 22074 / NRRL Y-7560 / DL-1) TaxID=871575 RepID=W1QID9_OGAPD|nr:Mitochondrial cell death effector that translocates to the nucleus in response to apoptotic stimuli [Ogataea parapolymorpha DL-1]ESX02120.1 Mitochondrial cell death effector that translocates to the nucleus in response to apoptotic stimuli [Ogataea parapolymorpha DL-1]KAG7866198.1 hypothetical protein KL918_003663 [Ogataea parapolymorpha]KAG7871331.1 hypothetical protein KL916_004126 [Ogataea parapolymorpha]